jgi:hypothetical protein
MFDEDGLRAEGFSWRFFRIGAPPPPRICFRKYGQYGRTAPPDESIGSSGEHCVFCGVQLRVSWEYGQCGTSSGLN